MKYFPIYVDLSQSSVLVVGGGQEAVQKVRLLRKTLAVIEVVAETIDDELQALADQGDIQISRRAFREDDVEGRALVYGASGDLAIDEIVSRAAKERGVNVNIVDRPDLCSFITPALVDRDPVTVAIGTEGTAPVLAREIRIMLERLLPDNYGRLARLSAKFRKAVEETIGEGRLRRYFWQDLFAGPFRRFVLGGREEEAEQFLKSKLSAKEVQDDTHSTGHKIIGQVVLVGCGPGDPGLLTLKAQQRLQDADILVVDRLVAPEILEYARRDAERIFVGKQAGEPSVSQEEINQILLREALSGKFVVRLKGGDPFVFGRAVEELTALHAAGIPVEVVPGITALVACAASAGLPITARGKVRKFSFLTGATADIGLGKDWLPNVENGEAVAIYMGVKTALTIKNRLLEGGLQPSTSLVIVENGSRKDERIIKTHLKNLDIAVEACAISGPAIIFVGLDWESVGLKTPDTVEIFEPNNVVTLPAGERVARQTFR